LEMYDQTVRESSGGEMLAYLRREPIPEQEFVAARLGGEFRRITGTPAAPATQTFRGMMSSVCNSISRKLARLVAGRDGSRAYDVGMFRQSGEVHRWMYDRYSLARLMESAGMCDVQTMGPGESRVPGWSKYNLDTEPDGSVYKPDSMYIEATRP
jgi:hypothetical protein